MRSLLCDADVPDPVINALAALRIPALSVNRIPGTADDDKKVVDVAHTLDAIIVALDRDYTAEQPLFAAMIEKGSRVVRIRLPKCAPYEIVERITIMMVNNYRQWQELLNDKPGIVSCTRAGNRFRTLKDFPWYKDLK